MKRLILIESSDIGARYSGLAARRLGMEPLFLCNLSNYQGDTLRQILEFDHINCETTCSREILQHLAGIQNIAGVMTFLDSRLEVAHQVARALEVEGLDPAVVTLKDKWLTFQLAPDLMPPTIATDRDGEGENWGEFLRTHKQCILKPRKTAGAIGVGFFNSDSPSQSLRQHMNGAKVPDFLDPNAWILQALKPGQLMSLEGYVRNGSYYPLGITGRRKIGNTESVATFPDDHRLEPEHLHKIYYGCQELLEKVGLKDGYFHIEFIKNSEGVFVIDPNIGRLGGGGIGELLALSHGIDPVDVFEHVIATTLRRPAQNPYLLRSRHASSIFYGLSQSATILQMDNVDRVQGYHTLILGPGQQIPPMGENNWSWVAIATGLTASIFDDVTQIKILTSEGSITPCF